MTGLRDLFTELDEMEKMTVKLGDKKEIQVVGKGLGHSRLLLAR